MANGNPARAAVLYPEDLGYVMLLDGYVSGIGGQWADKPMGIVAHSGLNESPSNPVPHVPFYVVEALDREGEPVLRELGISGPEFEAVSKALLEDRILAGGRPEAYRELGYDDLRQLAQDGVLPIDKEAVPEAALWKRQHAELAVA